MAARKQPAKDTNDNETLVKIFFKGFWAPLKFIRNCLAWLAHRPPLKQIGHALRWFFGLRVIRFVGKMLGFGYFRKSFQELKLVTWPKWNESRRLTSAVILFSIVFGAAIAVVDYGLDKLFKQILLK